MRSYPLPIANAFALLWPLSLAIPNFFGSPTRFGFLAFGIVALIDAFLGQSKILFGRTPSSAQANYYVKLVIAFAFCLIVTISVLQVSTLLFEKTSKYGLAGFVIVSTLFLWLYLCVPSERVVIDRRFYRLAASIPIYLCLAFILYLVAGDPAGVRISKTYSETLALFGIYTPRLKDLAGLIGSNTIGAVAALGTIVSWSLYRQSAGMLSRFLWLSMISVVFFILVKSDGRALLGSALVAILLAAVLSRRTLRYVGYVLALFLAASPWLIYATFDTLNASDAATSILTRQTGNGAELGVGTGRQDIWEQAFLLIGQDPLSYTFGHGSYGHYAAGISLSTFEHIFQDEAIVATLHNTTLQAIFDIGYAGTLLFILIILFMVRTITGPSMAADMGKLLFALLSLFMLLGLSEVIVGIYNLFPFFMFLALMFYCLATLKVAPEQFSTFAAWPLRLEDQEATADAEDRLNDPKSTWNARR